ncbi:MAG: alpha/beta fold hydrolase [Actinobacteria bacterium]|nr:MAG: alpha/beta fold hydrolase [Actinomycetota bacterium]
MEQRARIGEIELAYEVYGDGPPLVWCHGLASCGDGDRDVIDAFSETFTVLSYDARGHGRSSPVRDAREFSYVKLAEDAIGMLDHVGWASAIFTGASMGAATLARVACIAPDRARALVMARPGAMGDDGKAPPWLQMLFAGGAHAIRSGGIEGAIEFLMTIPLARTEIDANPRRLDDLRRDWTRHDPMSIAAALEGVPPTSPLEGGITSDMIRCRVLVIPGNDVIHPTEAGIEVARLIPGAITAQPFDSLPRADEVRGLVQLVRDFVASVPTA